MKHKGATDTSGSRGQFAASKTFTEPEQVLAGFFSTSTVGLAICDHQLRFQAINDALAKINGIPAEEHLGKTLRDILGTAAAQVEPAFKRVLVTGQAVLNFEVTAQLSTRTDVGHWIGNYFPIKDPSGTVKQVRAFVVEVTKQKRLEESLCRLTRNLLRIGANDQRRIARGLHDRLSRPNLGTDERAELLTQAVELLEHCILETRTVTYSDLRFDIFKVVQGTSSVINVGAAEDLGKAEELLTRLASKHDTDYFARDKRTGAIVARTHLLPFKLSRGTTPNNA